MGKTTHQLSFRDGFLDPSLYELEDELKKVDQLLGRQKSKWFKSIQRLRCGIEAGIRML